MDSEYGLPVYLATVIAFQRMKPSQGTPRQAKGYHAKPNRNKSEKRAITHNLEGTAEYMSDEPDKVRNGRTDEITHESRSRPIHHSIDESTKLSINQSIKE